MKIQPTEWENVFSNHISKWLVSRKKILILKIQELKIKQNKTSKI